jgi:NADH-quinone oxidoreductase subunit L
MPLTYWTFLISTLAISGVPLTSGFLSKDSILAATLAFAHNNGGINILIPFIAFSVAGMTAFYMFRLVIKTFFGEPRNKEKYDHCKESPVQMTLPLILLSVLSIFIFYTPNPIDVNSGWIFNFLKNPESMLVGAQGSIYKIFEVSELNESIHHAHYTAMALSILISGFGILMAYVFFHWRKVDVARLKVTFKPLYNFSFNKWYFDELYDKTAVAFTMMISAASSWFDRKIIDGVVNGSAFVTRKVSDASGKVDNFFVDGIVNLAGAIVGVFGYAFKKLITGTIQTYVTFLLFGLILLYFIFRII